MTIFIQECTMFNRLIYRELCTIKIKYIVLPMFLWWIEIYMCSQATSQSGGREEGVQSITQRKRAPGWGRTHRNKYRFGSRLYNLSGSLRAIDIILSSKFGAVLNQLK